MSKEYDSIIYMRSISLDVVIPQKYVWQFMDQFGKKFIVNDSHTGKNIKPVDSYYEHPNGWHIQVTVWENDEIKFYDFLKKFCERKKISFRDPREELEYIEKQKIIFKNFCKKQLGVNI